LQEQYQSRDVHHHFEAEYNVFMDAVTRDDAQHEMKQHKNEDIKMSPLQHGNDGPFTQLQRFG
jgi:hypothetical protein